MVWLFVWWSHRFAIFLKKKAGNNLTVNEEWYRSLVANLLYPKLVGVALHKIWFQEDGTTGHTIELVQENHQPVVI